MSETCKNTLDIIYSCTDKPVAGAKDRVILVPRNIITDISLDSSNHLIIDDITKTATERAIELVGNGMLIAPDTGLVSDEFGNRYRHRLPFKVYGNKPVTKRELEYMVDEPEGFVAIYEQNYASTLGSARYVVMGKDAGVYVTLLEDVEGKAVFNIELANREGFEEPHLPANFWDTDKATTLAKIEALLVADTP